MVGIFTSVRILTLPFSFWIAENQIYCFCKIVAWRQSFQKHIETIVIVSFSMNQRDYCSAHLNITQVKNNILPKSYHWPTMTVTYIEVTVKIFENENEVPLSILYCYGVRRIGVKILTNFFRFKCISQVIKILQSLSIETVSFFAL